MKRVRLSDRGSEVEVLLFEGDMLMRATGDIFILHWDDATGQGRVERWNHENGNRVVLERGGGLAIAGCWYAIGRNTVFHPRAEHLALVNYPRGGTW